MAMNIFHSRFTRLLLGLLLVIILAAWAMHDYRSRYYPMSETEIAAKEQACLANTAAGVNETDTLKRFGKRVTEPKTFYSRAVNRCLYTYLMIDPRRPEPTTYNRFVIKDAATGRELYLGETNIIRTWPDYLDRMDKLEKK